MLEPDVPEYLVDYCLVGDKRDDPNRASAPRAEQGIFHPDHPDGPGPTYAPRFEPFISVDVGAHNLTDGNLEAAHNQEIRRRTRVVRLFPNEASLLRLVSAMLAEKSEDWESGKAYINMEDEWPGENRLYRKDVA